MFEKFSTKLQGAIKALRGLNKISEKNVAEALGLVRDAFIEADVSFEVIKAFLQDVQEKAMGEKVTHSIAPGQQLIKFIYDALVRLLAGSQELSAEKPLRMMLVGLHGSGKTTTAAKLAKMLKKKGYRPLLVGCDVYRPAAMDQLEILAQEVGVDCYVDRQSKKPMQILKAAQKVAHEKELDAIILDTAGRLQIDEDLIDEVRDLRKVFQPQEVLLVADSALGQESVAVAKAFHEALEMTGIVLTKLDGDARGGAALSMKYSSGVAIKFVGTGEHLDDLEAFRADGMAHRILGMGDVVALVEKARDRVDQEEADRLAKRAQKSKFDLDDFLSQMEQIEKMGSVSSLMKLLPGMGNVQISPRELAIMQQSKAIIRAMTREERQKPNIISGSRKIRIAKGSGVQIKDVNHLLKQFEMMQKSIKMLKKPKGKKMMQQLTANNAVGQLAQLFDPKK